MRADGGCTGIIRHLAMHFVFPFFFFFPPAFQNVDLALSNVAWSCCLGYKDALNIKIRMWQVCGNMFLRDYFLGGDFIASCERQLSDSIRIMRWCVYWYKHTLHRLRKNTDKSQLTASCFPNYSTILVFPTVKGRVEEQIHLRRNPVTLN